MSKLIIDVSEHQGSINWQQVKRAGVEGVIIRCGFGDNIATQDDKCWEYNANECTRLNIPFGAYIYSYAISNGQIESEAYHVLRCIKGFKLSYPIYLDLEENGTEVGAVERAEKFGNIIEDSGYWCGIYANLNWWNNYLHGLEKYTKWVAQYNSQCDYTGPNMDIWQYSSKGNMAGISGYVDLNEGYRDFLTEIGGSETMLSCNMSNLISSETSAMITHTVQPGETLSGIASKYKITYQEIAKTNAIVNPNLIYAGQQLKIR